MFTCGELAKFTNPLTQFQGPLNITRWFFRTNRVAYHQTAHPVGNICPVLVLSLVELADPESQFCPFFISIDLYHSPSLSLNIQIKNCQFTLQLNCAEVFDLFYCVGTFVRWPCM